MNKRVKTHNTYITGLTQLVSDPAVKLLHISEHGRHHWHVTSHR